MTSTLGGLFDLSLEASGEVWTGVADLVAVAKLGHFTDGKLPWEKLGFSTFMPAIAA